MQKYPKILSELKEFRPVMAMPWQRKNKSVVLSVRRGHRFYPVDALFHLFPILIFASLSACLPALQSPDSGGTFFSSSLLCNLTGDCASYNGTGPWARTVTGGGGDSEFTAAVFDPVSNAMYAAGYTKGSGTFDFGNALAAIQQRDRIR